MTRTEWINSVLQRPRHPLMHLTTPDVLSRAIDRTKDYAMTCMCGRQCPMTLDGLSRIIGEQRVGIDAPPSKLRQAVRELVDEGKLAWIHKPDGIDELYVVKDDDVRYPEPVKEPVGVDEHYWVVNIELPEKPYRRMWGNDESDFRFLQLRLIQRTAEGAIAQGKAMIKFIGGEV